jgi:hypothetical protein
VKIDDEVNVKALKDILPFPPPITLRKDDDPSNFNWNGPPIVLPTPRQITFPFARSSPSNRPIATTIRNERTSPIEISFFFSHLTRLDRPDAASNSICNLVHSVLPRIDLTSHPPHAPSYHSPYAFQPAPLDLRLGSSKKRISFGLLSFTTLVQHIRGLFALLATPLPTTTRMERIRFSACFCTLSSSLRSVYIITTQFSFVLRSSFCSFSESP